MPTIEGGCLCGAIRYRSDAEPLMQVVCHCETCRKNSGSAFSMNVAVPQDTLRIESGSPRRYEDHSGVSGKAFYRFFCGDCGSPLFTSGEGEHTDDWGIRWGAIRQRAALTPSR